MNGDEKRQIPTSRHLELVIPKTETKWWPRLLKSTAKTAWIKVDFNKWKDEDEENDEEGDNKFDNFDFSSLGLPSGSAGMNNFEDDLGDLSDDDEDMPPLEDAEGKSGDKAGKEGILAPLISLQSHFRRCQRRSKGAGIHKNRDSERLRRSSYLSTRY